VPRAGHSSVALLEAVSVLGIPVIEVHLSTIFRRESFRHHSTGVVAGLGPEGCRLALRALARRLGAR
jgi:3-dehydroquinate dehydratase-2